MIRREHESVLFFTVADGTAHLLFSSYVIVDRNKTRFLQGAEIKYVSAYSKEDIVMKLGIVIN